MSMTAISLSPPLRDTLLEIGNVGVSRAARRLAELLGEPIRVAAPKVEACPIFGARLLIETMAMTSETGSLVCIEQELSGALHGHVCLLLPAQDARLLFQALTGPAGKAAPADAQKEIGNILISSCVSAIADMLGLAIHIGAPRPVDIARWRDGLAQEQRPMLLIHARLAADRHNLEGGLLLLLSATAAEKVMLAIQAQILAAD